jgi:hypothetical protein
VHIIVNVVSDVHIICGGIMIENKVQNSAFKVRTKYLIDWGVTVETAGTIEVIGELLNKTTFEKDDKTNVGQSLFIGMMQRFNEEFSKLSESEVKGFVHNGFHLRQERKRKRLKTGIITKNTFEVEFTNGGDIFTWLTDNNILKKVNLRKGYFSGLTESQKELIKSTYPEISGRVITLLGMAQVDLKESKTEYYYQRDEIIPWRSI